MNLRQSVYIDCIDASGSTATQSLHTLADPPPSFGSVDAVLDAMQACMDGAQYAAWLAPVSFINNTPGSGPYSSVFDKAAFYWRSSGGLKVITVIPAPKDIFLPSGGRVDLTNPLVMAYMSACQAALADNAGNPLVEVTSARRLRY